MSGPTHEELESWRAEWKRFHASCPKYLHLGGGLVLFGDDKAFYTSIPQKANKKKGDAEIPTKPAQ